MSDAGANQAQSLSRHAQADLDLRTDRNKFNESAERIDNKIAASMATIEADLRAEQARRHPDSDRSIARVERLIVRYPIHFSIYARLLNLREVLASDM